MIIGDAMHSDFLGHSLGGSVLWVNDRDQLIRVHLKFREVSTGRCRFSSETAPLPPNTHVIADFEFVHTVDLLPRESAVPDEFTLMGLNDQSPYMLGTVTFVPSDPSGRSSRLFRWTGHGEFDTW